MDKQFKIPNQQLGSIVIQYGGGAVYETIQYT